MSVERLSNKPGDPVVNVVLDQIAAVSQIDASAVCPDYYLGRDLFISRSDIQIILAESAKQLGMNVGMEFCRLDDTTPHELVKTLKEWQCKSGRVAA